MPFAARVGDLTPHPGVITGPACATVLIGGLPAAVVGDLHTCSFPPPAGPTPDPDRPARLPDRADRRAPRPGSATWPAAARRSCRRAARPS